MHKTITALVLFVLSVTLPPNHAVASSVHPLFTLGVPASGPFPSDRFTVRDARQITGLRVNLPQPDCSERRSDCEDIAVLNTLDGFNVQPRLSLPFDGEIDVHSVSSSSVFLIALPCGAAEDSGICGEGRQSRTLRRIGINQIVWDPFTSTLHVESDELLEQSRRYALIVTTGVRDQSGVAVSASSEFRDFRHLVRGPYKRSLLDAVIAARHLGVRERDLAVASVFTTRTVTAGLERMRDQIKAATPAPATFALGPDGERTVFSFAEMTSVMVSQQTSTLPSFTQVTMALSELRSVPGTVGRVAFGKFLAPDYQVHPGEFIPAFATRTDAPAVQDTFEQYFTLILPSGTPPPGGWPVAISGHGGGGSKEGFSIGSVAYIAAALATRGIASIHINFPGHGFGPESRLTVNRTSGQPVTFLAGGRGLDQDDDGVVTSVEGRAAAPPWTLVEESDGIRQAVADLMQLVRVIQAGVDVEHDGIFDLDPSRIFFFGQSYGAVVGTVFMAVEPDVHTGVITAAGGSWPMRALSPTANRVAYAAAFARRQPSVINAPGITQIEGVAVPPAPHFHENIPLRDGVPLHVQLTDETVITVQSPVINTVAGASEIQQVLERHEWVEQWANPVAYAPHLRTAALRGVTAKNVLFQFARADQTVPNPLTTSMLRAGELAAVSTMYRHDLASSERPALPKNPHAFAYLVSGFGDIARAAQGQIVEFLASEGTTIIQPEPSRFFDVSLSGALPEDLAFIP